MKRIFALFILIAATFGSTSIASAAPKSGEGTGWDAVTVVCPSGRYQAVAKHGEDGWDAWDTWMPAIVTSGRGKVLHPVGFGPTYGIYRNPFGGSANHRRPFAMRNNADNQPFEQCTFEAQHHGTDEDVGQGGWKSIFYYGTVYVRISGK